jgi:hypothetical protein
MVPPCVDDWLATILAKLEENDNKEDDTRKMVADLQLEMWMVSD